MDARQDALCDVTPGAATASAFGWAQRMLRRQLDTLSRLASAALRIAGKATQAAADAADVAALEKALGVHVKVEWALRLIDALRSKLTDDLQRLGRGEAPDLILKAETQEDGEAALSSPQTRPERLHGERAETERGDYERFNLGRDFSDRAFAAILKRPTDEIIALICQELGLSPDWPRLAEEAWARQEMHGGRDGAPLAPLPLDGGRVGDGGGAASGKPPDG